MAAKKSKVSKTPKRQPVAKPKPKRRAAPRPSPEPEEDQDEEAEDEAEEEAEEESEPARPELSIEEKKALFESLMEQDDQVNEARRVLAELEDARRDHIRHMVSMMGTGPFRYSGKLLTLVVREGKRTSAHVVYLQEEQL